ncbi:MAG: hypothetical protein JXA01_09400 [Dehalococcoidia bacterium]|nr:hypothetical protein [Dehalococcoidia bacterium]
MRKLTMFVLSILAVVLIAGCARLATSQVPPLAYIDSVSSAEVYSGETIKFSGHGVSSEGQIVAYNWRSSVNGDLSQLATFDTNTLTAGPHTIWFKVQDDYGNWSKEIGTNVNILTQGSPAVMAVKMFAASPPSIAEGESTTLSWEITGTGNVRIDPGIGDVAQSGNRVVKPLKTTIYTIYSANDIGVAKASTEVVVTPTPQNSLIAYSIAAEDGTIRGGNITLGEVMVGQDLEQNAMQAFLSFDTSSIPSDAIITSVQLDLTKSQIINHPIPWLGSLYIYNKQYGFRIDQYGNQIYLQNTPLYTWSYSYTATEMPETYFTSPAMVSAVQAAVDTRSSRLELRLQFEKTYYYPIYNYSDNKILWNSRDPNYIDIGSGTARLLVNYTLPE